MNEERVIKISTSVKDIWNEWSIEECNIYDGGTHIRMT